MGPVISITHFPEEETESQKGEENGLVTGLVSVEQGSQCQPSDSTGPRSARSSAEALDPATAGLTFTQPWS